MNWWAVLEIIVGALISIGFVMWEEKIHKPKLVFRIEDPPVDVTYQGRPAQNARFLRLITENIEPPHIARWLSRNTAIYCHAILTFYHLDGQNIFGRSMQGRWAGSPEPVPIQVVASGQQMVILDPVRLSPELHRDIHSGQPETLDVAARFDNDTECYGWCNDNYFSRPVWRNPDWRMGNGRFLVKVTVNAFRLENAQQDDYKKISPKTPKEAIS